MTSPDTEIQGAFDAFIDILCSSWNGEREREAVSTFAFGPLLQQVSNDGFLTDPTQIAIEMAVPQVAKPDEDSEGKKDQVCKDLVLWEEPLMVCWDDDGNPTRTPGGIIEWKFDRSSIKQENVEWLQAFTSEYPECIGYAVTANRPDGDFLLSCTRVEAGNAQPEWVYYS